MTAVLAYTYGSTQGGSNSITDTSPQTRPVMWGVNRPIEVTVQSRRVRGSGGAVGSFEIYIERLVDPTVGDGITGITTITADDWVEWIAMPATNIGTRQRNVADNISSAGVYTIEHNVEGGIYRVRSVLVPASNQLNIQNVVFMEN